MLLLQAPRTARGKAAAQAGHSVTDLPPVLQPSALQRAPPPHHMRVGCCC